MEVSIIVKQYLESIGGLQCMICNEWSNKDTFVGPMCSDCNDEVEEILAEAEDW